MRLGEKRNLRKSKLTRTLKLFKNKKILLIILFDILFLVSISAMGYLVNIFFPKDNILNYLQNRYSIVFFALSFSILYLLLLIFIYSFFKYNILDLVRNLFKKTELSFKRLTQFYLLNIIIICSAIIIILILDFLLFLLLREQYIQWILFTLSIPIIILAYSTINISHSIFIDYKKLKDVLMKSLKITFNNMRRYIAVYLIDIIFLICFLILFYTLLILTKNSPTWRFTVNNIFSLIWFVVFYLIILFNRLYFYIAINDKI
jgi:hypothetical protein